MGSGIPPEVRDIAIGCLLAAGLALAWLLVVGGLIWWKAGGQ